MQIVLTIPKEFDVDYKTSKFAECFDRLITDIEDRFEKQDILMAGNYEKEILQMFKASFLNSEELHSHGILIDIDEVYEEMSDARSRIALNMAKPLVREYTEDK